MRARLDLDIATMLAGQLAREVEAEAGAADLAGVPVLDPLEAIEQAGHLLASDADAVIDYPKYRNRIRRRDDTKHPPAVRRVLDGVLEQIADDGLDPVGVAQDRDRHRGCFERQHMIGPGKGSNHLHRIARDAA